MESMDAEAGAEAGFETPGRRSSRSATRRPHTKSRHGCLQCKQKKIKCDETKPSCEKCNKYSTQCSFLLMQPPRLPADPHQLSNGSDHDVSRSASPKGHLTHQSSHFDNSPSQSFARPDPSSGGQISFSILDMELLHFYTLTSSLELPHPWIWKVVLPQLGFEYPFLMQGILALAALHKASIDTDGRQQLLNISRIYEQKSLETFQKILPLLNAENCHAMFAYAMVLMCHAWASPDHSGLFISTINNDPAQKDVDFIRLQRGAVAMIYQFETIQHGPLRPMFEPWIGTLDKNFVLPDEFKEPFDHLDEALKSPLLIKSVEEVEVVREAVLILRKVYTLGLVNSGINEASATLSWPSLVPEKYILMIQDRRPAALIVLAYYTVLVKRIGNSWWMRGNAEPLMRAIKDILGVQWAHCIRWPLLEVGV